VRGGKGWRRIAAVFHGAQAFGQEAIRGFGRCRNAADHIAASQQGRGVILIVCDHLQGHQLTHQQLLEHFRKPGGQGIGIHRNGQGDGCVWFGGWRKFLECRSFKDAQRLHMAQQHLTGMRGRHRPFAFDQHG